MKRTHTTLLLILLGVFSSGYLFGKIRNGYASQLPLSLEALQSLNSILDQPHLSSEQERRLRSRIASTIQLIVNYELTEELIDQLRLISPDIYNELDTLRDKRGRLTDVYIRLIPWKKSIIQHNAASYFSTASSIDADANVSSYGDFSVAVNIWTTDNALVLLSHELGHVKYIVPNLADYSKFYNFHYTSPYADLSFVGHHHKDQSGKYAKAFERRLLDDRSAWLKNGGDKPQTLYMLALRIKRNIRNSDIRHLYPGLVPSVASKQNIQQSLPAR